MRLKLVLIAVAAATLASCDGADESGLTARDNRELNEATEMLDASPDSLAADENMALGNGEAPSAETGDLLVTDENSADAQAGEQP